MDGIHATDEVVVTAGVVRVLRANDGLEREGTLTVDGGALTLAVADDGLVSADTLTVNGGSIEVTSGVEGIESKDAVTVNGGSISLAVSDDGLNASNDITINGGSLYVTARADAVDSNGTITINGGLLVGLGGHAPEGGLDCDRCSIALDGGTVVATGGENSTPADDSRQRVLVFGSVTTGTLLHVEKDGADVLTFRVSKAYQKMVFTSPALASGATYRVYTGGSVSDGSEFHGLYSGATYTPGSVWADFTATATVTYVGTSPSQPGGPGRPGRP